MKIYISMRRRKSVWWIRKTHWFFIKILNWTTLTTIKSILSTNIIIRLRLNNLMKISRNNDFVDFIWFLSMMEEIIWLNDGLNERMSNQKWVRKSEMSYIMKWRVMEVATWREEERKGMNTRIFHNLFCFLYRIIEFYSKLCWKHIHYGFILNMVYSNHEYIHY